MSHRTEPLLGFSPEAFRARRERALAALEGSALVLPAAPAAHKSRDTERRYRADSELFYLTGVVEPGALDPEMIVTLGIYVNRIVKR